MKSLFDSDPPAPDVVKRACDLAWVQVSKERGHHFTEMEDSRSAFVFAFEAGFAFCELWRLIEETKEQA